MAKRKRRLKLKVKKFMLLIFIIFLLFLGVKKLYKVAPKEIKEKIEEKFKKNDEEEKMRKEYENCLIEKYDESDNSEELINKQNEITNYIKNNYRASILYEDEITGYTYKYNEEQTYYGASLIKIVDAMYLFDKAEAGEIDIYNTKLKYDSKYVHGFSTGMKTKTVGEEVSLEELIKFAMTYSDNSAHFMLIDYIGVDNLKEYAQSLGATKISVIKSDTFGMQNAVDTNIYLHHAYEIINSGSKYGKLLKEYMLNNDTNALNLNEDEITIAHKYGQYDTVYHDIGISFEESPYYISILTSHGRGKYVEIVNDISGKIKELHDTFHEERKNKCNLRIYGS